MVAPSDVHKGYPEFFRINPIIGWSYDQVWTFIKDFQVPYCPLYDEGTTFTIQATPTLEISTILLKIRLSTIAKSNATEKQVKHNQQQSKPLASKKHNQIRRDTVFE